MNFWWCNQSGNWHIERLANVVCSEGQSSYRRTVGDAKKGDIIVHYKKPLVVAFSRAREDGRHHEQLPLVSGVDYGSGWRFRTEYFDLVSELHRSAFIDDLAQLSKKNYAVNPSGKVKQGYFLPFDRAGVATILKLVREPVPTWLADLGEVQKKSDQGDAEVYQEGEAYSYLANRYERDTKARAACIEHYKAKCWICHLDFGEEYGPFMTGFIHVHHIVPLSKIRKSYEIAPVKDLRPVCPNCHAAIHQKNAPSMDELVTHFQKK